MTVVLAARPSGHSTVPLLVGIAAARAIEDVCPDLRASIEWPNDLIVTGRKVGGILCESWDNGAGTRGMAIGTGINISQRAADFPPGTPRPRLVAGGDGCGLRVEARPGWDAAGPAARPAFSRNRLRLKARCTGNSPAADALNGRTVLIGSGEAGTARGISAGGALLFEKPDGIVHEIRSGSVTPLPDPPAQPARDRP